MADRKIFDAIHSEISRGITLVEAGAGTGKTFAIAMLVLRAVVEQGIKIDQVLVVTFTIAATEELKERIRAWLSQGRNLLSGISGDYHPVLREWADHLNPSKQSVERLNLALLDIDRAAIYTIHGFCQRMLKEQALESGQLFDVELTGDIALLRSQMVQDYWRSRLYPLEERYCALITSRYPSPGELYKSIAGAENTLVSLVPEVIPIEEVCADLDRALTVLRDWWQDNCHSLRRQFDTAADDGFLKKDVVKHYPGWWDELSTCFAGNLAPDIEVVKWLRQENMLLGLNGTKLRGLEKKQAFIADWSLPEEKVELYLEAIEALIRAVRLELAMMLRDGLSEKLRKQGGMSFDDLIIALAAAVSERQGAELRQQIGERYRLALIDEFQDTDSAQWTIFSTLFGDGKHILYLIGDPKQAIYRFRGADIFSYFKARDKADTSLTLTRNFRSNPGLMAAVNDLFDGCEIAGQKYRPIEPAKTRNDGCLKKADGDLPGLEYVQLGPQPAANPSWYSGAANERIMAWITVEIAALITRDSAIYYEETDSTELVLQRRLKPADIAILVRTNSQAETYQDSLGRYGIPAVISSKKPVFRTVECDQLFLILQAVAALGDTQAIKAAMSCDWFGLSGDEHYRITSRDLTMNKWYDRFQGYYHLWLDKGFLPMINSLLAEEEVFIHLCARARAERRMANIQHLIELVQEAEQQAQYGISQTLLWLQKMIAGVLSMEEMELRLESDVEAVNIITMHSAKGLEFPIVFCPFLLSTTYHNPRNQTITRCYDRAGILVCDLGSDEFEENKARAGEEERQEDLRLAYVAITRAKLRCYLFWADIRKRGASSGSSGSSLGYLLFPDGTGDFEEQQKHLRFLGSSPDTDYRLIDTANTQAAIYLPPDAEISGLHSRIRGGHSLKTNRTRTSFSGLAILSDHAEDEDLAGAFDEKEGSDGRFLEISSLPGGVRFGNIVHDILEMLNFSDLAGGDYNGDRIALVCQRYGLDIDQNVLHQLLKNCVTTPLLEGGTPDVSFTLAGLERKCLVKEMNFTLHLENTVTSRLNEILGDEPACTALSHKEIEGYLTGYIDLICEHGGRYYIVDYKTNNIGKSSADYSRKSMQKSMRMHNYGLQYWLYTLVVHRYLRKWLPGYSYDRHFGGVMYLFVRGMVVEKPGSGVYYDLPDKRVLIQLDHCLGEEGAR